MARLIELQTNKTYANKANAIKAVDKVGISDDFRYILGHTDDGRYYPIFLGGERCIQAGIHSHFHVVG